MEGRVDNSELRRVGTRKQRGIAKQKIETVFVLVLHGDRVTNHYSIFAD